MVKQSFRYGLDGRVALVTGSGQGIGQEVALRLAAENVTVVVNGRTKEKIDRVVQEIGQLGKKAIGIQARVERKNEILEMVDQIIRTYGRIDYLVNNAGVSRSAFIKDMSEEDWDTVIDINLKGTFLCSQAVIQHMIKSGFGRIVNLCSIASFGGQEGRGNYSASKSGLMALTRVMAIELARYNIRVNAVAPGLIDTELIRKGVPEAFLKEVILDRKPLGRLGQTKEIAEVILFLLSEASSYITGETILADGGLLSGYFNSNSRFGESFPKR